MSNDILSSCFGHVAISVSDLNKSIEFYEHTFGFKCVKYFDIETANAKACFLRKGKLILELFKLDDFEPLPEYRKTVKNDFLKIGVKHFAFSTNNIDEIYDYLKGMSVEFATKIRVGGSGLRYFFIKDPDGILVEIIEKNSFIESAGS